MKVTMKNINDALEYLNRDYLINASIIDPILRNAAEILYASADGVMVKDKISDVIMIQAADLELGERLLDELPKDTPLIVAHSDGLADLVERKFGFDKRVPCYQGVYRKEPFILHENTIHIRLLSEEEADDACSMYRFDKEDAIKHIRLGLVYGGFVDGKIVGMAGLHYQGSMGLLEVKPEHRRNGYGEILEKFIINTQLAKGAIPYCQIVDNNTASLALQAKLGLDLSKNKLYWMRKDKLACN